MKRMAITIVCALLSMSFFSEDSKAQFVLGVNGEILSPSLFEGSHAGCAVTIGKQMKKSSIQTQLGYSPTTVHGDLSFLMRAYGNKDHSINIYMGAGATGVLSLVNDRRNEFVAGLFPVVQAEKFISKKVSLYADIRTPFLFLVGGLKVNADYSLGIRFLFYREDHDE